MCNAYPVMRECTNSKSRPYIFRAFLQAFLDNTDANRLTEGGIHYRGLEFNESAGPVIRVAHPLYEDRRLGLEQVFCLVLEDKWRSTLADSTSQGD